MPLKSEFVKTLKSAFPHENTAININVNSERILFFCSDALFFFISLEIKKLNFYIIVKNFSVL